MMNEGQALCSPPRMVEEPVLARLKKQKKILEEKVVDLSKAIEQLESNPEVTSIIDSLNKLGY